MDFSHKGFYDKSTTEKANKVVDKFGGRVFLLIDDYLMLSVVRRVEEVIRSLR